MRLIQFVIAAQVLASCAASDPGVVRFSGKIDDAFYERYTDQILTGDERKRCESTSLSKSDVVALIDEYDQVDSYMAYQTLTVTPCIFKGEIAFKGRTAKFLWYPSGYMVLTYPDDASRESEYFICPGQADQDGVYSCNREHELSQLR